MFWGCFVVVVGVVVVGVVVVVVVFVVFNVDVVVRATLKVDLMLLSMEVEFPGGDWWVGGLVNSNNYVKPNSVELSWGCVEVELGLWQ